MFKHLRASLAALPLAALFAIPAIAQTTTPIETYLYGQTQAPAPYGSGLRIPAIPNGSTNAAQYIPGNLLATLGDTQTLTNKTINCANNVCTVRANLDMTGILPVGNGGTGGASFTAGMPLFGAGGGAFTTGSLSGNTTKLATTTGALSAGHTVAIDASGNFIDSGGTGGGSGTVTSVGLTAPSWLTVSGSPVTVSGTLALTGTSEPANQVLASPNGSSGAVVPRSLVNADLPASGVTAASYTSANITVNAQGIVTAASNGSGGGGGTSVVFVGTTAGGPTAYTMATTTPTGFTATPYFKVCGFFTTANTGAATLNVNSTGAIAIQKQTIAGLSALSGGEIPGNNTQQCLQLNSGANIWVLDSIGPAVTNNATSITVTQSQWANGQAFVVTTAGQTLTLPQSNTLATNSGIIVSAIGNNVTLTPNAADSINSGSAGASVTIGSGALSVVTTDGAGHIFANPTSSAAGANLNGNNTWTKGQAVTPFALTDGATVPVDATQSNAYTLTLTGNHTLANPSGLIAGQFLTFVITQDATGSRTLNYGTAYKWPSATPPTLSTAAAAVDVFTCLAQTTSTLLCGSGLLNIH